MESLNTQICSEEKDCCLDFIQSSGEDGPWNMALDEALARLSKRPLLRLYMWPREEATFGYAQSLETIYALAHGLPLTRRISGGGLVRHGEDITLTFFAPRTATKFPQNTRAGYRFLHGLLCDVLNTFGVQAALSPPRPSGAVCFEAPICDDLIQRDGHAVVKIAGGAQRRLREGILHQGSIKTTAFPPNRHNLLALGDSLAVKLASALGASKVHKRPPEPTELELATHLRETRYANPSWNNIR